MRRNSVSISTFHQGNVRLKSRWRPQMKLESRLETTRLAASERVGSAAPPLRCFFHHFLITWRSSLTSADDGDDPTGADDALGVARARRSRRPVLPAVRADLLR